MDETTTTSIGLCGNKIEFSDRDWNKIDRVEVQEEDGSWMSVDIY